jgi:hypothetical protein
MAGRSPWFQNKSPEATAILFSSESGIDQGFPALHPVVELFPLIAEICLATAVFIKSEDTMNFILETAT